jgi:hypothetical protein
MGHRLSGSLGGAAVAPVIDPIPDFYTRANEAFSYTPTVVPPTAGTWSIAAGSLPSGLSLNTSTGEISGATTPGDALVGSPIGDYTLTLALNGTILSNSFTITAAPVAVPDPTMLLTMGDLYRDGLPLADPLGGTRILDDSQLVNDGTGAVRTPFNVVTGNSGDALEFNRNSDTSGKALTQTPAPDAVLPGTSDYTLAVTMRTSFDWSAEAFDLAGALVCQGRGFSGVYNSYILALAGSTAATPNALIFREDASSTAYVVNGTTVINDGNWHSCVVTVANGGNTTLYVDGSQEGQTARLGTDPDNEPRGFHIGQLLDVSTRARFFDGDIDEVAFWKAELSSDQAEALDWLRQRGFTIAQHVAGLPPDPAVYSAATVDRVDEITPIVPDSLASSPTGRTIKYERYNLPRNLEVNEDTGVITGRPYELPGGDFSVIANDGFNLVECPVTINITTGNAAHTPPVTYLRYDDASGDLADASLGGQAGKSMALDIIAGVPAYGETGQVDDAISFRTEARAGSSRKFRWRPGRTIAFAFQSDAASLPAAPQILCAWNYWLGDQYLTFFIDTAGVLNITIYTASNGGLFETLAFATGNLYDGNWHHVVVRHDREDDPNGFNSFVVNVDGGADLTNQTPNGEDYVFARAGSIEMGYGNAPADRAPDAKSDELSVYPYYLSDDEVTALWDNFNAGNQAFDDEDLTTIPIPTPTHLWTLKAADISGTTAIDKGNSPIDGTIENGPVATTGPSGAANEALLFDGINQRVVIPHDPLGSLNLSETEDWTIGIAIDFNGNINNNAWMFTKNGDTSDAPTERNANWYFRHDTGSDDQIVAGGESRIGYLGFGAGKNNEVSDYNRDAWTDQGVGFLFYVLVYNAAEQTLYLYRDGVRVGGSRMGGSSFIDGLFVGETFNDINETAATIACQCDPAFDSGGVHWNGKCASAMVFKGRALFDDEIAAIYKALLDGNEIVPSWSVDRIPDLTYLFGNDSYSYTPNITGSPSGAVTWESIGEKLPSWLSLNTSTGELSGTVDNEDADFSNLRLRATDAAGDFFETNAFGFYIAEAMPSTASDVLGYYNYDNANISGTTLLDAGPAGNDATIVNAPTTGDPGVVDEAFTFNPASSQYLDLPAATYGGPITMMIWFNSDGPDANQRLINLSAAGGNDRILIAEGNSSNELRVATFAGASGTVQDYGGAIVPGTWQHFFVVFEPDGTTTTYIDGELRGVASLTAFNNVLRDNSRIAADQTPANYGNGTFDETAIILFAGSARQAKVAYEYGNTGRALPI